ncbi:hypothetical protein AB1Y20_001991 [Prymnesium parvum]|uniref:Uncharacterized protein n=1 Tax=Prymnesium parvum TaxID=97485 RepID=A0AB34J7A9_PRYPA
MVDASALAATTAPPYPPPPDAPPAAPSTPPAGSPLPAPAHPAYAALTSTPPLRFSFVGDGRYCGDGGAELERLWRASEWKPLKGCDGRFTCRERALAAVSLPRLAASLALRLAAPVVCCRPAANGCDGVQVVRLRGGGGVLSYEKPSRGVYVHTLNTESGLSRKLIGLGCEQPLIAALNEEAAMLFSTLTHVLRRIPEPERTRTAPAVCVAMRVLLARSATRG